MDEKLIISISREFGSGGYVIAEELAKRFALPLYDHNLLREIAVNRDVDAEELKKYDEVPKSRLLSRTVRDFNSSPEHNIASLQFDYLKKKAAKGDSFVIVGRCSETILKEFKHMVSIFVLADPIKKIERISAIHNISKSEAESMIKKQNRKRKNYHNHHSPVKWGDSRNYDISINSSTLGIDETTNMIEYYVRKKMSLDK